MKNYMEIERELRSIPTIKTVSPYQSDNFISPWVIGFIPLTKNIKAEISYGTGFNNDYIIGFTLFENGKLMPYERREKYDRCFMENEIDIIFDYVQELKEMEEIA